MSATGPVDAERLLEIRRAHSFLTIDLVTWPNNKLSVSLGFTPLSAQNPESMTRYVTVATHELSRVIGALEAAQARIEQESTREENV